MRLLVPVLLACWLAGCAANAPSSGGPVRVVVEDIDGRRGGEPMADVTLEGDDADAVRALLREHFPTGEWTNFGPDAGFRRVTVTDGQTTTQLRSWHPLYEQNPGVVATSGGLTSIGGRTRAEVLAADDPVYVQQRGAFDSVVRAAMPAE